MAIELFCYVSKDEQEAKEALDVMTDSHRGLFTSRYLISKLRRVTGVEQEIAHEFGIEARFIFLVSLNEKNAADLMSTVIMLIKNIFGSQEVLILFNNEDIR